jgi:hypothetical protein
MVYRTTVLPAKYTHPVPLTYHPQPPPPFFITSHSSPTGLTLMCFFTVKPWVLPYIFRPLFWALICRPLKEHRNRFPAYRPGTIIYLAYRPARLHRLAESIPGLLKRLQIWALVTQASINNNKDKSLSQLMYCDNCVNIFIWSTHEQS